MFFSLSSARKQSIPYRIKTPAPASGGSHTMGCICRQEGQVTPDLPSFSRFFNLSDTCPWPHSHAALPWGLRTFPGAETGPPTSGHCPVLQLLSHSSLCPSTQVTYFHFFKQFRLLLTTRLLHKLFPAPLWSLNFFRSQLQHHFFQEALSDAEPTLEAPLFNDLIEQCSYRPSSDLSLQICNCLLVSVCLLFQMTPVPVIHCWRSCRGGHWFHIPPSGFLNASLLVFLWTNTLLFLETEGASPVSSSLMAKTSSLEVMPQVLIRGWEDDFSSVLMNEFGCAAPA